MSARDRQVASGEWDSRRRAGSALLLEHGDQPLDAFYGVGQAGGDEAHGRGLRLTASSRARAMTTSVDG